jgi:hypothetical protein
VKKKLVLIFLAFIAMIYLPSCDKSQATITVPEVAVNIPDINLQAVLRQAIGKSSGPIYNSELEILTILHAPECRISNLDGLQYCKKMTELNLGNNNIRDLSPLAALTQLTRLNLVMNKIRDVSPLSSLVNLETLWLDGNDIDDVSSIVFLDNLKEIHLTSNPLNDASLNIYLPALVKQGTQVETDQLVIAANPDPALETTLTPESTSLSGTPPATKTPSLSVTTSAPRQSLENANTWQISGNLYLLTSQGVSYPDIMDIFTSSGFHPSLLGGGMSYIYANMAKYWDSIKNSNTFIIFNAAAEYINTLSDWPAQFQEVQPFATSEIVGINLPFAFLKQDNDGLIRAIIAVESESELTSFLQTIIDKPVPVNIPWTISNQSIVEVSTGGSRTLRESLELSDTHFKVYYPDGYQTDASNILTWANMVVTKLETFFPDFLSVIGSQIIIELSDKGDSSSAHADVDRPSVSFVAPSVSLKVDAYYDTDWYTGNLAHEIGHIYLEKIRNISGGYQRTDTPGWFDEGFGEYLRLLFHGEQVYDQKYSWYVPEIDVIINGGLGGITNDYAGGSWVFRFMDSYFGMDTIKTIITDNHATFWGAVTAQTGLTRAQFEEQLIIWLKER